MRLRRISQQKRDVMTETRDSEIDFAQAIEEQEARPNDVDAYNRLGRAHIELGEYSLAREAYKRGLEVEVRFLIEVIVN